MRVADELPNDSTFSHLGSSALYLLATLPEEERTKEHETSISRKQNCFGRLTYENKVNQIDLSKVFPTCGDIPQFVGEVLGCPELDRPMKKMSSILRRCFARR